VAVGQTTQPHNPSLVIKTYVYQRRTGDFSYEKGDFPAEILSGRIASTGEFSLFAVKVLQRLQQTRSANHGDIQAAGAPLIADQKIFTLLQKRSAAPLSDFSDNFITRSPIGCAEFHQIRIACLSSPRSLAGGQAEVKT